MPRKLRLVMFRNSEFGKMNPKDLQRFWNKVKKTNKKEW